VRAAASGSRFATSDPLLTRSPNARISLLWRTAIRTRPHARLRAKTGFPFTVEKTLMSLWIAYTRLREDRDPTDYPEKYESQRKELAAPHRGGARIGARAFGRRDRGLVHDGSAV